jgi:hypothetical protein
MADRDWDKELAKVDKQLASLSDEALLGSATPAPVGKGAREPARVPARSAPAEAPAPAAKTTSAFGVYARLTLAVTVAAAMMIWPYPSKCGLGLIGYLAAIGVVVAGGLWSSVWTWRHRAARAHWSRPRADMGLVLARSRCCRESVTPSPTPIIRPLGFASRLIQELTHPTTLQFVFT